MSNLFLNDIQGKSGGFLIVDEVLGHKIILLGKSNSPIKKKNNYYESFGGNNESQDLTSLHTAIRELIEEFFNIKVQTDFINNLAIDLRNSKFILKQHEFYGMSYLINFSGLNFIFQKLSNSYHFLNKYKLNNKFNLKLFIDERKITELPYSGLNEIQQIQIFKLDDILNNKIHLRWFTNKIINLMLI